MNEHLPKSREEAKLSGSVSFFTGEPCQNGHVDKRYTNTGICYSCKRDLNRRDRVSHHDRAITYGREQYQKHKEKVKVRTRRWAELNPQKVRVMKDRWKDNHRDQLLESYRQRYQRKKADPFFRLTRATSLAIWRCLKHSKGGRHWENLVGFSLEDLKEHLSSQFRDDMCWANYGTVWEIDHIKPLSRCATFEEAWQLSNLQPLYCSDNRSKGNKWND